MNYLARFENRSKFFWIITGLLLLGGIGILDLLTGYEVTLSLFYLIPISLVTWYAGHRLGLLVAIISALVWLFIEIKTGKTYSQPVIYVWNTFIEFSFYLVVVFLLSALRTTLENERKLAQTDYLTGAVNSRFFFDLVRMEIHRSNRYHRPFTIVYFDIDDFKAVNDQYGHTMGDQVLQTVARLIKEHIRETDVFARLGGDEFALLLPETDQNSAQVVLAKIHHDILAGMGESVRPMTLSIGVLTCVDSPTTPDEIIKMVDDLMYAVKRNGKNAINYALHVHPDFIKPKC